MESVIDSDRARLPPTSLADRIGRRAYGSLAAAVMIAGLAVGAAGAATPPAYSLRALHASLFYNDSGTFSPDIPANASLFNTIIGEGWAAEPSSATLVRVTVAGARGSYAPNRSVELVVRKGRYQGGALRWGTVVLRRSEDLGVLSDRGSTTVGFWIPDTGCVPLKVTATLRGQPRAPSLSRVIRFACGE
jgi:hypothetical protein